MENTVICGRNPVLEALKSGANIDAVYICGSGGSLTKIATLAKEKGIPIKDASAEKLNFMCDNAAHQGVAAAVAFAEYVSAEEILEAAEKRGTPPLIIVCDEIQDPHNLGAIIRTAEAAGADGVIIPKRNSASVNHTVFKTSAGAASWLPIARVSNIAQTLDELKKRGVWIYGAELDGALYSETDFKGAVALVIGSEGKGLRKLTKDKCDFLVKLPMLGQISSLNASVAAGILMYECVRQRKQH